MILQRVEYLLFESDAVVLDVASSGQPHEIDREVRLDFADMASCFVSWCSQPLQYCVGLSDRSFFSSPAPLQVDGSAFPAWASLVGRSVDLAFVDDERQTLRVTGATVAVLLESREGNDRYRDVLRIRHEVRRPGV
jgi:hypothetical protein